MTTFRQLATGRVNSVDVFVNVASTEAKSLINGIYEMTKADFDLIAQDRMNSKQIASLEEFLEMLEDGALGDRWLRLSDVVAQWIDSRPPKIAVDESIF